MVQYNLDNKPITELQRLKQLRLNYYNELVKDISQMKIRLNQKIKDYKITVLELDKKIEKEQNRENKTRGVKMAKEKTEKKKPVMSFKDYPVQISIWKSVAKIDKKNVTFYNSTLETVYKNDEDEYKTSSQFKELDLLKATQLCQKAYNWINNAKQKDYDDNKDSDDEDEE